MDQHSLNFRNFLFFLSEIHPLSIEDSCVGALARPSSWTDVSQMITTARLNDPFVQSIQRLQLYIHVPFCGRLCSFCHCARYRLRRRSDIDGYMHALQRHMDALAPAYEGMKADTLCFGGGTPSVLNAAQMTAILDAVDRAFPCATRKILFEINPSSWSTSKLVALSGRGLHRLSIGVQSLDPAVLQAVGRPQTKKKVIWSMRLAHKAKIPYVNVDLMAGLPKQTLRGFIDDLRCILDEGANIVHVYPYCDVSFKELRGTASVAKEFFKRRDGMMRMGAKILQEAGFQRRGLSAYTKDGKGEAPQEEAYTNLESAVAGFGPFAKSQFPGALYHAAGDFVGDDKLPPVVAAPQDTHYAMAHYIAIKLLEGLDATMFAQRFQRPLEADFGNALRYLEEQGLVCCQQGVWQFDGPWQIGRIRAYVALSRVLFGEALIARLYERFNNKFDPKQDYSRGNALLKAYANSWMMTLYYRMGV